MLHLIKNICLLKINDPITNKLKLSFQLFFVGLWLTLITSIIKAILIQFDFITNSRHPTTEFIDSTNEIWKLLVVFLLSVFLHPFMEELSFRLWVTKNKKEFSFGVSYGLIFIIAILFDLQDLIPINKEVSFDLIFFLLGTSIGILIFKALLKINLNINLRITVFLSSFLFAVIHLNVAPNDMWGLANYLIFLLPLFIKGLIFSYARITMGLQYSILIHVLNNLLIYLINIIF